MPQVTLPTNVLHRSGTKIVQENALHCPEREFLERHFKQMQTLLVEASTPSWVEGNEAHLSKASKA